MAKYDWNTSHNYVAFLAGELAPGTRRPHHDSLSWLRVIMTRFCHEVTIITDKESTQHAAIFKQHSINIIKVGADITISDHSDQHNWHIVTSPPFKKDKIR